MQRKHPLWLESFRLGCTKSWIYLYIINYQIFYTKTIYIYIFTVYHHSISLWFSILFFYVLQSRLKIKHQGTPWAAARRPARRLEVGRPRTCKVDPKMLWFVKFCFCTVLVVIVCFCLVKFLEAFELHISTMIFGWLVGSLWNQKSIAWSCIRKNWDPEGCSLPRTSSQMFCKAP